MAYRLEHQSSSYINILNKTFENWTNSHPDIFLLSAEGHKIYTPRIILRFYSSWLSDVFDSFSGSGSGEDVGISLQASSNSIISMMKVLTTGLAVTKVKSDLTEIEGVAMSLGIDFQNWQIGSKKKKLPAKSINSNNLTASKRKSTLKANVKQEKDKESSPNVSLNEADPIGVGDNSNNEKGYECSQCFKTFSKKDKLNRHVLTHSGVKFGCEDCGSEFSRKDKLNKHRRDKHDVLANGNDTVEDNLDKDIKTANFSIIDENEDIDNDNVNEEVNVDNEQSNSPDDKDAIESGFEINAAELLSEEMEIPDEDLMLD